MELTRVAPDLRTATRRMPAVPASIPLVKGMQLLMRFAPNPDLEGVTFSDHTVGRSTVRVYTPEVRRTDGALLWIHGGGLVLGDLTQDHRLCGDTAALLGVTIVSANYRLAPAHPFPAPSDDCLAAWQWMHASAGALGIDPARILIGGQSAGGGLAAGLVQRIHDLDGPDPLAQWLLSPMLDDRTAADREWDAVKHRVWNNRANRMGWKAFLGQRPGGATVADYAVPARRADLSGLPATFIGVGDIELFYDEDVEYAERLREAGIDVTLDIIPGAPHGFEAWAYDTATAQAYLARGREWLARRLGIAAG